MLPASKEEFPKCLYLDQNKWIDLARAHYGRPEAAVYNESLHAVQAAISSGKLIVPFSTINSIEMMISENAGRRERLARFMVELSGNYTILPEILVSHLEMRNAIARLFGRKTEIIRPITIKQGLSHLFGIDIRWPAEAKEMDKAYLHSSEMTVEFLLKASAKREPIHQALAGESAAVGIFEKDREHAASLGLEQRRRMDFKGLFFGNGLYRPVLTGKLNELGISPQDFLASLKPDSGPLQFLADIPNLDVLLTLRLARDQDSVRRIERNDIRDLDWLSVALPYSNCVVMENYWCHQVCTTGLDVKYGTVMLTDLRQLPEQLRAMGCIT